MRYWQILPIGPVDARFGYSPYASTSTFAGNWLFISLEMLAEESWFSGPLPADTEDESLSVSFEEVIATEMPVLESACKDFFSKASSTEIAGV